MRTRSKKTQHSATTQGCEWVGGRAVAPFHITEGEPYRPEMVLWIEVSADWVVGATVVDPSAPAVSFADSLREAMAKPLVGPPRRPTRVRVATARLAAEVREAAPDIAIDVAPTPELDQFLAQMAEFRGSADSEAEPPSYFEGGRVSQTAIEGLFRAAELLYRAAPWRVAHDGQVLRLDIPRLGVEGACLSIIGALGESLGLIIFPSLVGYEAFLAAGERLGEVDGPIDVGTTCLALDFERGADLPTPMRREVAKHAWPVAGPAAYPMVVHRDRDGLPRPLSDRDFQVVSACATALIAFFAKHREVFEHEKLDAPICESFLDGGDLEVRFTVPYEAGPLFQANDRTAAPAFPVGTLAPPASADSHHPAHTVPPKIGRNEPCPCGSGKKYKKCCLGRDQGARAAQQAPARIHELDQRLFQQMVRFAGRRFGEECFERAEYDFDDFEASLPLFAPWIIYHLEVEGQPVVQSYLEDQGRRLSPRELTWLQAQQAAWLSVWEVLSVERGQSITLKDLLSGEERIVQEVLGSSRIACRDALLARVVDHDGISVLGGSHPRLLPPLAAAELVQRVRGRLRRKRDVPVDRLRPEKIGRYMIHRWEEAVEELDVQRSIPPQLQNTDGEELLLTVDHFEYDPKAVQTIEQRLAALEDVDPPEPGDPDRVYVFTKSEAPIKGGGLTNTLIGRVALSAGKLRLETNSVQRADALRSRLEGACGELVRHRAREHADPLSAMQHQGHRPTGREVDDIPPEQANQLVLEMKATFYAGWPDDSLPALSGQTPREAIRTAAGRRQVDVLLKQHENQEACVPEGQRFDFSELRRALGLEC